MTLPLNEFQNKSDPHWRAYLECLTTLNDTLRITLKDDKTSQIKVAKLLSESSSFEAVERLLEYFVILS